MSINVDGLYGDIQTACEFLDKLQKAKTIGLVADDCEWTFVKQEFSAIIADFERHVRAQIEQWQAELSKLMAD